MSVNKVILIGNVGKDPEVKHLENGVTVARFPLATNETYTDKSGQRVTQTEWHNIVVWRNQAEIAEKYVKAGKLLYIEGKLRTSVYEDKETGAKRYFTDVQCSTFRFLGPANTSDAPQQESVSSAGTPQNNPEPPMPEPEDDLPF
ncbi:MAG TPA: single-stranded DNA-binding protein [Tenuifilaceae bacterium]|nr:single-stranded DNA-binding protein [Tenuifilaceae bacterium]HPE17565.1 single-stranded DNA-binding protein [Tenuifilaceae bacterium]HPJ45973.1 single-stranded DNA-binding protein [Tenuifilaceae bacterium]HPQ34317.1 single-stranded DNA-binding protein [Tenuifilaceae bacterium]HRX67985.1 single-stranded DNA-binding protein [Tenuifilaceae bacterium]